MAEPFLDSLKNLVPSLEKATEVNFCLLLTSFVLFTDCTSLYVHGMNILHLSEVPDVIKPRLAIEAVILVIGFGVLVGIAMPFVQIFAGIVVSETAERLWTRFEIWAGLYDQRFRPPSAMSVSVSQLREKAHATKESYYRDLLKEAETEEAEHWDKTRQTALFALTVLVLSGVNLYAPLSPNGSGILTQIADGLGQNGYGLLFVLGFIFLVLAFYPVFENYHLWVHCPELAQELDKKRREEREERERFRREAESRKASPPSVPDIGGRLGGRNRSGFRRDLH